MSERNGNGDNAWVDPDDAPELTAEHFERADVYHGERLVRRGLGHSASEERSGLAGLRIDQDVLERFRATGPGWETRINEALRQAAAQLPIEPGRNVTPKI